MLDCQRDKFFLNKDCVYLNGAYMSPLLRKAEISGILGIRQKRQPNDISIDHFFDTLERARGLFAQLIHTARIAQCVVVPSVSYAMANAAQNIPLRRGQKILMIREQFPSNYYSWTRRATEVGAELVVVAEQYSNDLISKNLSISLLEAIDEQTAIVCIPQVHWSDGSIIDLRAISQKVHQYGGYLVVDGTQSVGAYPLSVADIDPDVLVVASYKWMMGAYSIGMAYYSTRLNGGNPIEDSWLNRIESDDFSNLVSYQERYRPGARRYEVGEASNFVLLPMMIAGMEQVIEWRPERFRAYCKKLADPCKELLRANRFKVAEDTAGHLFGVRISDNMNIDQIKRGLSKAGIVVSYRGDAIRVSPSVYNTEEDMNKFVQIMKELA